jgi:hypothetical protein
MSETEQNETELVSGVIEGVTQKRPDTWQVAVKPEGSQYAKNLWTKDSELVTALSAKLGQHGAFVCGVSHWTNSEGKPVRSLWVNSVGDAPVLDDLHIKANVAPTSEGMTPEKWDAKERRDYRSRAWAQTLAAFQHTIKVDEDPVKVFERLQPFQRKVYTDVTQSFAFPDDDSDIPF